MKKRFIWIHVALSIVGLSMFTPSVLHADENSRAKKRAVDAGASLVHYQTRLAPVVPWNKGRPMINGPHIFGASPGKPFLYRISAIGERPLRFSAEHLPAGLFIEPESGQIKGRAEKKGDYLVLLKAENKQGKCEKKLTLVIRDNALALTPPMGWNSWNCYRRQIDAEKIKAIANGMISSGLAANGYSYVNMDSGWQSKKRGGPFNSIVPTELFPDMKALCDHIHALGLKAGIYSGPYVGPCGTDGCGTTSGRWDTRFPRGWGHFGQYIGLNKHEHEDVSQWADWGFDYLKYDWHKTDMILAERMSQELRNADRDMILSLAVNVDFNDAFDVKELANLWRSNGDSGPLWDSFVKNGFNNQQWNIVIGPGHWFDLDMTAFLPRNGKTLSHNEMIAWISCWMMRPSPIMVDCPPAEMDDFMLRLLCNVEIIDVNQDALGMPAVNIFKNATWNVQVKPLSDGNYALSYFNLSEKPAFFNNADLVAAFRIIGINETCKIRDLWNKEDLGAFTKDFKVGVDTHCAKIYKIFMP